MRLSEFKAWFEGFSENIGDQPTKKQWKRIQLRVEEIDGTPLTREIIRERYVEPYRPWWPVTWYSGGTATGGLGLSNTNGMQSVPTIYNCGQIEARALQESA